MNTDFKDSKLSFTLSLIRRYLTKRYAAKFKSTISARQLLSVYTKNHLANDKKDNSEIPSYVLVDSIQTILDMRC